jgi:hypothetical protein
MEAFLPVIAPPPAVLLLYIFYFTCFTFRLIVVVAIAPVSELYVHVGSVVLQYCVTVTYSFNLLQPQALPLLLISPTESASWKGQ